MGFGSFALAIWLAMGHVSWWKAILGALLLMFGWGSLRTGISASDEEIEELTSPKPLSESTRKKFEERF
tara:strand:- start:632 stop:838 length:207 start_codon:yes stop_codon:yes gene_type:complete